MATLLFEFISLLKEQGTVINTFHSNNVTDKDALLIIDMQNDFLPGGAFAVAEGNECLAPITKLISVFDDKNSKIVATKDYHPIDHCSFCDNGGLFPPHCIQGTHGSYIHTTITKALQPLVKKGSAHIVFKGFSKSIDSFGAFPYSAEVATGRIAHSPTHKHCGLDWTGSFVLFSSNMNDDCNAPPDVMAVFDKIPLETLISRDSGRVFIVGLALDFCVLDSAINAARLDKKVTIIINATRAAYVPGLGKYGSGFLSDPEFVAKRLREYRIDVVFNE